jgi:hypothetical protein
MGTSKPIIFCAHPCFGTVLIMTEKVYQTFEEFWPYYVGEHRKPATRQFHFMGTTLALANGCLFLLTFQKRYLLSAAISGYFFAWVSHFLIEKNRPATFQYPLKSLIGDFKMFGLMLQGKMDEEMQFLSPETLT